MSPLQGDHVGSQPTASTELKESYGSILKGSMGFFYYLYMLEVVCKECPYCHGTIYKNIRGYANHVRWCKDNPNYDDIRSSTIQKLQHSSKQSYIATCIVCKSQYDVVCTPYIFESGKYRRTCCDACAKILTTNNSNLTERNLKIKKSMEIHKSPQGSRIKICLGCGNEFCAKKPTRLFCCNKCSANYRRTSLNINIKQAYHSLCDFKFGISSYPDEFNTDLIKQYGWYSAANHGNNLYGVSRDHMFSCDEGWKQKIDPYILSHPANCQLMLHSENSSKHSNCSISLDDLKKRIIDWHRKYGVYKNTIDYSYFDKNGIVFDKFEI